jgi:signal transduction histidine kinase/ligand-binding sensor domain-containing protein
LPTNVVLRVAQSGDGYLWLATTNGATRFDGVRFTTFDHTAPAFQGRIDYAIQPMLGDRRGVLWIATNRELVRYTDGRFVRDATLDDSVVGEAIAGVTEDSSGTLWALTDHGRLRRRDGARLAPVSISGLPRAIGQSIVAGDSGQLWLGFAGYGLINVRPRDSTVTRVVADESIGAILRARDGTIWAGTTTGVVHIASGRIERVSLGGGVRYAVVTALGEDRDGGLWIGTQGNGLYRYDAGRITHLTAEKGLLTNDDVLCTYVDSQGSVWVGTRHGLNRFHSVALSPLTERNGLPTVAPGAIAIDRSGALWMAPRTGGLYRRVHADSGAFVSMRSTDIVSSIAAAADSSVWIGRREAGVLRYHAGSWRAYPTGPANAVLVDHSGVIWVATAAGLQRLWHEQLTTLTGRDGLADSVVLALVEDGRGSIWAGTSRGLSRIDHSGGDPTITSYRVADGLGASVVSALLGTRDGAVWAGTIGGLTRFADGRLVTIRGENGLVPELVTAMAEDERGYLWLAGFRGLRRVPLAELNAVADSVARGQPARLRPVPTFMPADGVPSPEVAVGVQVPTAMAATGRLWFAMERGLVSFDPALVHEDTASPLVHIERVTVDGVPAPDGVPLTIGPSARRVELDYTAVSLREGLHVRFRYRLAGFDTAWVDAGSSRTASYTNLSPGRYRFSVAARAADGPWGMSGAVLSFRVLPPFYLTPWFLIAATIATVVVVVAALRARTRVLEARFAAVLAERTRLAREIHDTLLQGFAGVALSLRAATRRLNAPAEYTKPLDDVLALAQRTIADARQAVWDLRAPILAEGSFTTALENAARQAVAAGGLKLEWTVFGRPRALSPDVESVLLRVSQEALTNTVKHASAQRACVALMYERRVVRLTVRDDGCGFRVDPSYQSYAGHWGLLGMRERVQQMHGTLRITSEEGKGTEASLTVPYE